jgi:hypothetical protein
MNIGGNDIESVVQYCGKLPLGANGSGVTPVINDISWNFHKLYKKEKVLACTGSFGTCMFRRPNGDVGSLEDLEQGWKKVFGTILRMENVTAGRPAKVVAVRDGRERRWSAAAASLRRRPGERRLRLQAEDDEQN